MCTGWTRRRFCRAEPWAEPHGLPQFTMIEILALVAVVLVGWLVLQMMRSRAVTPPFVFLRL